MSAAATCGCGRCALRLVFRPADDRPAPAGAERAGRSARAAGMSAAEAILAAAAGKGCDGVLMRASLYQFARAHGGLVRGDDPSADLPRLKILRMQLRRRHPDLVGDWDLTGRGELRLLPCPHCGNLDRLPLRLRGALGAVCLRCRRDRAGFLWPAQPYDRYRQKPRRPTWRQVFQLLASLSCQTARGRLNPVGWSG